MQFAASARQLLLILSSLAITLAFNTPLANARPHPLTSIDTTNSGNTAPAPFAVPSAAPPTAPLAITGVPQPPTLPAQASYVLMDARTGAVIAAKSPNLPWPPASLAKLMTAYLTYQALADGTLKMNQTVPISDAAWHTGGSRMFIAPNMSVTVNQLLHGLIIDSGNDAAVALAQAVAGNRQAFVGMMNEEAAKLHLTRTHYTDVDGLPNPVLRTTAMDVAKLSLAIIEKYPQYLRISVEKHYTFDKIRQRNWNPVLFHDPTVDGLKTGRTDAAGHCIDATALRNGRRLIAVVLGGPSWEVSTNDIEALLDYGYRFYTDLPVTTPGKIVGSMPAPNYRIQSVPVAEAQAVVVTIPILEAKDIKASVSYAPPLKNGIVKGAQVGTVTVTGGGKTIATVPAIAEINDSPAGFITRTLRRLHKWL